MKCPICDIELGNQTDLCPFCRTPLKLGEDGKLHEDLERAKKEGYEGKYSKLDPNKDSYDFDLQYTLTFKDADEIRKAVKDLEVGLGPEPKEEEPPRAETPEEQKIRELEQRRLERKMKREGGRKKSLFSSVGGGKKPESRQEKPRREDTPQQKKTKRGILIGSLSAVVVIALIFGAINLFASMMKGEAEIPTVYLKDNSLFMYYGGKTMSLSENMIVPGTAEPDPAPSPEASKKPDEGSASQKKAEEQPAAVLTEKDLIQISPDGSVTYYFENFNMASRSGDLIAVTSGKKGSRQKLASNVYYHLSLTQDGKSLMFLSEATPNGENGKLFYWTQKMEAPQQLSESILDGNFVFAQDGKSVLYVSDFNAEYHVGNLISRNLAKGVGDVQQLDADVAAVFGTNPSGTIRVYAKNYNKDDATYDVYSVKDNATPAQLTAKSRQEPVFLTKSDRIYAYDAFENDAHTLVSINLDSGEKKSLTTEVTEVVQVSLDESAAAFTKEYDNEGKRLIDYYYVGSDGVPPQKIANNVGIFEDDQHARIVQFDISDDFSRVAYIAGFNPDEERGALYTESIINGVVGTEKRISDNAYSCNVASDGSVVRYANSYNRDSNTVDIQSYTTAAEQTLAQGVGSSSFTFDRSGEYTVYARNYNAETKSGDLESVDKKAKMTEVMKEVNAYGLKDNGETIFFKNLNLETSQFDLYFASQKGDKTAEIDTQVTKVLVY